MYLGILRLFTVTNCTVTLSIFYHFIITPDELKDEQQTWISKVAALNEKTENLLGDALVSAAYICILPPFNKTSRWDIIKLHYAIELHLFNTFVEDFIWCTIFHVVISGSTCKTTLRTGYLTVRYPNLTQRKQSNP